MFFLGEVTGQFLFLDLFDGVEVFFDTDDFDCEVDQKDENQEGQDFGD